MSFLLNLNPFIYLISRYKLTFSTTVLIFFVSRFYLMVLRYPKGPFPYPLIGNLSYVNTWTSKINPHKTLSQLHLKYGPVFTIWLSHKPLVFISDARLVKKAFQRPEYNDRGQKYTEKLFTLNKGLDFLFNNYSPSYIEQKKIILSALRKYMMTDELNIVTNECVEESWNEIRKMGLEQPIDMPKYLSLIVTKIMAKSLYGARYTLDDPELMNLKNALKKVTRAVDMMNVLDGLPDVVGQFLFDLLTKTSWLGMPEIHKTLKVRYQEHLDSYESGLIRDVTDALIAANKEAILEDRESATHLNDHCLLNILVEIFIGSIDSTSLMCEWIFLLMAKHPKMQSKMRKEIGEVIGDRLPTLKDKDECHFTMAFINESLRLYTPFPMGVFHQNKVDVEIGGHKIPAQTMIISYQHAIHRNANHWSQPEQFDPNRMLNAGGKLQTNKLEAFLPFSVGRRACPGEKLALIDGFLVVARMLQLTNQMNLEFASDGPIEEEADPSVIAMLEPVHYKLLLKPLIDLT